MKNVFTWLGYALGVAYAAFTLLCMGKMSGSLVPFLDLVGLLFTLWVLSPVALVTWLQAKSKLWWIALLPTAIWGALANYDMAFHPSSSTAALGLIFFPLYQWAFVGVVSVVMLSVHAAKDREGSSA